MTDLKDLPNIGNKLEEQLILVGITSKRELEKIGSKETWLKIKEKDPSACYNRLCALEGAIRNTRWHDLDKDIKNELKKFYDENKE